MRFFTFLVLVTLVGCQAKSPAPGAGSATKTAHLNTLSTMTFSRGSGGSVTTNLGYGIQVNPRSSLQREWIAAHDSVSPIDFDGTVGVTTVFKSGGIYSRGEYRYEARVPLRFKEDVSAFEVRFVLFDIWGQFTRTLSSTEIEDVVAGAAKTFTPLWAVYSENDVSEYYASIAYIARVRTKTGRIFEADREPVLTEARKFTGKFEPGWLNPGRGPSSDSSGVHR